MEKVLAEKLDKILQNQQEQAVAIAVIKVDLDYVKSELLDNKAEMKSFAKFKYYSLGLIAACSGIATVLWKIIIG